MVSEAPFLAALAGQPVPYTPVWFMRQAGRYQPEYRKLREYYRLVDLVRNPELGAQVAALPVQKFGFDAAILFADITTPLEAMGAELELVEGKGPVFAAPLQPGHPLSLHALESAEGVPFIIEALKDLKNRLAVPVIGFAGGPFTLASYLIEGGPSRNFLKTKTWMYQEPESFAILLEFLAQNMAVYLNAQLAAGAAAVQIFDSWAGSLAQADFQRYLLPSLQTLVQQVSGPVIYFTAQNFHILELIASLEPTAVGLGTTSPLPESRSRINLSVQGNLDPALLFAPESVLAREIKRILAENSGRPGHIFNLGHGILPGTPETAVARAVELVKENSRI